MLLCFFFMDISSAFGRGTGHWSRPQEAFPREFLCKISIRFCSMGFISPGLYRVSAIDSHSMDHNYSSDYHWTMAFLDVSDQRVANVLLCDAA
jgi:hypothetical protein